MSNVDLETAVLIVDDDEGVRKTISEVLKMEGFTVVSVANGKKALKAAEEQEFNVAIIDIRLPDIDGMKLLDQLKETSGPRMVKIIITGYPELKSAVDAVNKGADGYIFKPVDMWKLLKMIREQLRRRTDQYIKTYMLSSQERSIEPIDPLSN